MIVSGKKYTSQQVTQSKADAISWMASGKSLLSFSRLSTTPNYETLRRWRLDDPEFDAAIPRARMDGTDVLAEECLQIADDNKLEPADKRIRIDTRLRLIGKWNARQYGNKVEVAQDVVIKVRHTFPEPGGPEVIEGNAIEIEK
jgi:hypothetical protein